MLSQLDTLVSIGVLKYHIVSVGNHSARTSLHNRQTDITNKQEDEEFKNGFGGEEKPKIPAGVLAEVRKLQGRSVENGE